MIPPAHNDSTGLSLPFVDGRRVSLAEIVNQLPGSLASLHTDVQQSRIRVMTLPRAC